MAKHEVDGAEPDGDELPGVAVKQGQHSKPLKGFEQKHLHHDVEPHIAHSPRTLHGDL